MNDKRVILPGRVIQEHLDKRAWTHDDLANIVGRHRPEVTALVSGKRKITPQTAIVLGKAFGTTAAYWLGLEAAYRLSLVADDPKKVGLRRRLFELGPLREMAQRGWISSIDDVEKTQDEVLRFFQLNSLEDEPMIGAVTRKSDAGEPLTASQRAWCFRVKQIAESFVVSKYNDSSLDACARELRRIAAYPQEVYEVPSVLSSFGIRFVVVEALKSSKVDGVAMWLDDSSPVIGMSLRYDRVDSFWHTLCHELSHVRHQDQAPLDCDLTDTMASILTVRDPMERRADEEAAHTLIPRKELESFIMRVGPMYSKVRIIQFAHRMKIHPGIIVGQLQHRREIGYSANREMLKPIRETVISAAITDGWGHVVGPRSIA